MHSSTGCGPPALLLFCSTQCFRYENVYDKYYIGRKANRRTLFAARYLLESNERIVHHRYSLNGYFSTIIIHEITLLKCKKPAKSSTN